ncbi:wax ester/triacylglycerol synthase family O-acyltransferase [Salinibacter altiplanensis]|uniref:wax ester/triacylglycerol synthase family O-acyltransferase n=1 Tax=Salinibacter altiplanensis TaxID=1803181 RepID=UPI001E6025F7|nr:wax ester/triacylglycerol synthase family O-acyltransferase [Salinibacter altiplanensis]
MSVTTTPEPLSGVDAAWLRMDEPTNLMTITGVLLLDDPMDVDTLKALLEERFLGFDRFRQRVRDPEGSPHWERDPHFDLDRHVHRTALPGAAGTEELKERVGERMSEPLDREKPLWEMDLVEDYLGGSALIVRLHHCIGDGMALLQVLLSLTDEHFDPGRFPTAEDRGLLSGVVQGALHTVRGTVEAGRRLLREGAKSLVRPSHALRRVKQGLSFGAALSKFLSLPHDDGTPLKGELGVKQRATWSAPLDLTRVKRIGAVVDAKVNDVLLGAVAGALRYYLTSRPEPTDAETVRALIPVNLRPPEQAFELGNRFGLVFLDLPVGLDEPLERVLAVKQRMDTLKGSAEAVAALSVLEGLGYLPLSVEDRAVRHFSNRASAVMTNVPGPQEPLHMKGRHVQHVMPWVPRAGHVGLGVSIFSYDGTVRLGIASDAGLIPDPDTIIEGFEREFDRLADTLLPAAEDAPKRPPPTAN